MTKYQKNSVGHYVIKGKTYQQLFGSRAQVMHGTAYKTTGELTREALIQNKHGRIVSRSKFNTGKNKNKNNLLLNGYTARKGHFGPVKMGSKTHRRGRHRRHGGTTDATNARADETVSVAETPSMKAPATMGSVPEGVNNSMLAGSAAPFSGGSKRREHGGTFLGGSRRRKHCSRKSRASRRRGGAGLPSLSPAPF